MNASTALHRMRLEGAYHRAQHYGRLLAAAAEEADGSEASYENIELLQTQLTEATEAAVWLESLSGRDDSPRPAGLTDFSGHVDPNWLRKA